jgi:hypothetical protein
VLKQRGKIASVQAGYAGQRQPGSKLFHELNLPTARAPARV